MLTKMDEINFEKLKSIFYYEGTNILVFWENDEGNLIKVDDIDEYNYDKFNLIIDDPNNDGIFVNESNVVDLIKLIEEGKEFWSRIRIYKETNLDEIKFNPLI